MAKLLVRLHGQEVAQVDLESGNEYIAGRANDVQIQLNSERGISRQHLKFYEKEGVWVCEALSKFVKIQKGDQSLDVVSLAEASAFSVPPYEFYFDPEVHMAPPPTEAESPEVKENLPAFYQPRVQPPAEQEPVASGNDATMAGAVITLVPYLRIGYPNTADDEVLKLEGHLWTAGRDPSCEIPIDSPHVSRKHFELSRSREGFFITDLGSSNGTNLNGQRVPPHEPTRLESGDELQVKSVTITFEIRDTNFANRLGALPVPAFNPMLAAPPVAYDPAQNALTELPEHGSRFLAEWTRVRRKKSRQTDTKKWVLRGAIGVLVPVILYIGLSDDKSKPAADRSPTSAGNTSVSFDKLTNEQRSVIKDSFSLARNLYVQGKYELCLTELAKLHELIPQYENSKELQSFCEQGRELVQRQRDLERKERERALIEQQISGYVEGCKMKLKDEGSVEDTRQCLAEAMELDPEHHLIVEMIHTAQMHEEEKKFLDSQKKAEEASERRGVAHYNKAKDTYKKGQLSKSIVEFERFLGATYPHTAQLRSEARREVASIKKELKDKVTTLLEQCRALNGKQQWKEAYIACDHAVGEDPGNQEAKDTRTQVLNQLKGQMKGIYEDSVLEESLGNVDSAKEKWKKIISEDLENGDYATKAKGKLQKYGPG